MDTWIGFVLRHPFGELPVVLVSLLFAWLVSSKGNKIRAALPNEYQRAILYACIGGVSGSISYAFTVIPHRSIEFTEAISLFGGIFVYSFLFCFALAKLARSKGENPPLNTINTQPSEVNQPQYYCVDNGEQKGPYTIGSSPASDAHSEQVVRLPGIVRVMIGLMASPTLMVMAFSVYSVVYGDWQEPGISGIIFSLLGVFAYYLVIVGRLPHWFHLRQKSK